MIHLMWHVHKVPGPVASNPGGHGGATKNILIQKLNAQWSCASRHWAPPLLAWRKLLQRQYLRISLNSFVGTIYAGDMLAVSVQIGVKVQPGNQLVSDSGEASWFLWAIISLAWSHSDSIFFIVLFWRSEASMDKPSIGVPNKCVPLVTAIAVTVQSINLRELPSYGSSRHGYSVLVLTIGATRWCWWKKGPQAAGHVASSCCPRLPCLSVPLSSS